MKSSSLPASGAGTTSGLFLVRMTWSGVTTPRWLIVGEIGAADEIQDLRAGAEVEHEALRLGIGRGGLHRAGAADDRRDLGRREASSFGSLAAANTLRRPLARRCSARVTCAIMRS